MTISTRRQAFCKAHTRVWLLMGEFMSLPGRSEVIFSFPQYCTSTPLAPEIVVFVHIILRLFQPILSFAGLKIVFLTFILCCFFSTETTRRFCERQQHRENSQSGNGQVKSTNKSNPFPPLHSFGGCQHKSENIERRGKSVVSRGARTKRNVSHSLWKTDQCSPALAPIWKADRERRGERGEKAECYCREQSVSSQTTSRHRRPTSPYLTALRSPQYLS